MHIVTWTTLALALFNVQYSYDVTKTPVDESHLSITNGTLKTCIYPSDKPFKKGSKTFPRSELRCLEEYNGNNVYTFAVNHTRLPLPPTTDFSVWQVFGSGKPLLMLRHRSGQPQMVVFDGEPKIQPVESIPKECTLDCKVGKVTCGRYEASIKPGKLRCKSVHLKVGVYSQQTKPKSKTCIEYREIKSMKV